MKTSTLRSAYAELISEARRGGFGEPPEGEWNADQIVAHVAANDELLTTATRQVLSGAKQPYYNHDAIDTARLDDLIAAKTDVVQWLEQTSSELCDLAEQVSEGDMTLVHTKIVDGAITRVDRPLPWPAVLRTQAETHLPRHIAQLRALRGQ